MLHVTPQERLALGVVALLLTAGAAARVAGDLPAPAQWEEAGAADTDSIGSLRALRQRTGEMEAQERVRRTPLAPGERLDPNRAGELELQRLPRVGPALARRIVQRRAERGPFRSLADLDSVPGVGPALLGSLAPLLELPPAPASGPAAAAGRPLDLNRATAEQLDALPGIGPVLARRITEWRQDHGGFASVQELERVPGIGRALVTRLTPLLHARP